MSDLNKSISRDYDVLLEKEGIALRGLFIIDPQGIVRQITINDLPIGRSVDETLRLIEALQFVEKHGEGIFSVINLYKDCGFSIFFSMFQYVPQIGQKVVKL